MSDSDSPFDENGNLKIFKQLKEKKEFAKSARNVLLLSGKIIIIERDITDYDTPKKCKLIITLPFSFNTKFLEKIYYDAAKIYSSFSKLNYSIDSNVFSLEIVSGSKRCSFCKSFIEFIDSNIQEEIFLINDSCLDWTPHLKEKLPETEYENILNIIRERRLEYFANTTEKYRDVVMKRDNYRCLDCGTDGNIKYKRRNGELMENPLQIHHIYYDKDTPDSLMTLCQVCHYKLHRKLFRETGYWSSRNEKMT